MSVIRDWWRGWSDDDLESVLKKLAISCTHPGAVIFVTNAELRAHVAYMQQRIITTLQFGAPNTERDNWE